jgi:hypothetical protein
VTAQKPLSALPHGEPRQLDRAALAINSLSLLLGAFMNLSQLHRQSDTGGPQRGLALSDSESGSSSNGSESGSGSGSESGSGSGSGSGSDSSSGSHAGDGRDDHAVPGGPSDCVELCKVEDLCPDRPYERVWRDYVRVRIADGVAPPPWPSWLRRGADVVSKAMPEVNAAGGDPAPRPPTRNDRELACWHACAAGGGASETRLLVVRDPNRERLAVDSRVSNGAAAVTLRREI